jgi:hypothetical protein
MVCEPVACDGTGAFGLHRSDALCMYGKPFIAMLFSEVRTEAPWLTGGETFSQAIE